MQDFEAAERKGRGECYSRGRGREWLRVAQSNFIELERDTVKICEEGGWVWSE
jgi:hypothetical protein